MGLDARRGVFFGGGRGHGRVVGEGAFLARGGFTPFGVWGLCITTAYHHCLELIVIGLNVARYFFKVFRRNDRVMEIDLPL